MIPVYRQVRIPDEILDENIVNTFEKVIKRLPLDRALGFIDGKNENSWSRFNDRYEVETGLEIMEERVDGSTEFSLNNYCGAYLNGYLFNANPIKRALDYLGKSNPKFSFAMDKLCIECGYKDNIYWKLNARGLLVHDVRDEGNSEPRYRLEVED